MALYRFYQLKTKKSEIFQNGLRQVSLVCENHPEVYCFLWLTLKEEVRHIQFVFNENILEWDEDKGLSSGQTNRKTPFGQIKTGVHKGSRTIHISNCQEIMKEGIDTVRTAQFPARYQDLIRSKLVNPETS